MGIYLFFFSSLSSSVDIFPSVSLPALGCMSHATYLLEISRKPRVLFDLLGVQNNVAIAHDYGTACSWVL